MYARVDEARKGSVMSVLTAVRFVCLLTSGALGGFLPIAWFGFDRAMAEQPRALYVPLQQAFDRRMPTVMVPLFFTGVVSSLAHAAVLWPTGGTELVLAAVAAALTVASLASSGIVNVPINRQVMSWNLDAVPHDWQALRARWMKAHAFRSVAMAVAFALQIAAVLTQG
jgi:hypothetical protein